MKIEITKKKGTQKDKKQLILFTECLKKIGRLRQNEESKLERKSKSDTQEINASGRKKQWKESQTILTERQNHTVRRREREGK